MIFSLQIINQGDTVSSHYFPSKIAENMMLEAQGGYSGFQVMGMIMQDFFGFEIFDSGIFLGKKFGKYFFG